MFDHENTNPLTPAERELEAALARLAPVPRPDDRAQIAYAAGHRAARRQTAVWRTTSGALAATLALTLVLRPTAQPAAQPTQLATVPLPVYSSPHLPASTSPPPSPDAYLVVRDQVLAQGLDALPAGPSSSSANPSTPRAITVQPMFSLPSLFGGRS